ncbi:retrovirus-related pol polyprotein from transposon TNT 1-94 [Tanacetum coccineum]
MGNLYPVQIIFLASAQMDFQIKVDDYGDVLDEQKARLVGERLSSGSCKNRLLNGELNEVVYVSQPEGFVDPEHPSHVYRLKKALYGLKQATVRSLTSISILIRCHVTRDSTSGSAQFLDSGLLAGHQKHQKYDNLLSEAEIHRPIKDAVLKSLGCNSVQHSRSKHIDIRHHFIKEQVERKVVELYFVETKYQLADIFTKALPRERFATLLPLLGVKQMSPETLKELQDESVSE